MSKDNAVFTTVNAKYFVDNIKQVISNLQSGTDLNQYPDNMAILSGL